MKYDFVSLPYNGMTLAMKDEKFGYLDAELNEKIPFNFVSAGLFDSKGFANVKTIEDGWFKIDKDGDPVGPADGDEQSDFIEVPVAIGAVVDFIYKDNKVCGEVTKVNPEKKTFSARLENGKVVWRYWNFLCKK